MMSPLWAGLMNSRESTLTVTNSRWANFEEQKPAALSINAINRPPNKVPYELVSPGKTSSANITGSVLKGSNDINRRDSTRL